MVAAACAVSGYERVRAHRLTWTRTRGHEDHDTMVVELVAPSLDFAASLAHCSAGARQLVVQLRNAMRSAWLMAGRNLLLGASHCGLGKSQSNTGTAVYVDVFDELVVSESRDETPLREEIQYFISYPPPYVRYIKPPLTPGEQRVSIELSTVCSAHVITHSAVISISIV